MTSSSPQRSPRPDPTRGLLRAGLILCGVALTWTCAAFGLFWFTAPHGCGSLQHVTRLRLIEIRSAITAYQIEEGRCPATTDELLAGRYVKPANLVDRWETSVYWSCTDDEILVTSAGPDRRFGTRDDIADGP